MATVQELARELERKRAELHAIYEKAMLRGQVDPETGAQLFDPTIMTDSMVEEVRRRDGELKELNDRWEAARLADIYKRNQDEATRLRQVERQLTLPGGKAWPDSQQGRNENFVNKKLSDMICDSTEYQLRKNNRNRFSLELEDVDMKTLMTLSGAYAPANPRTDRVVLSALRRPVVADLIPTDNTTLQIIKWMEETTFTNAASTTSEGGTKQEAALAYTERSATVEKIATWIPATEEQLDDVNGIRNLVDNRLTLMLLLTEEDQLLNGSGVVPNILGFLNHSSIQTQAFDTNNADTVYKAFTKVRWTGFAEPSAVVMHPNNWQTIRLMKTSGSGEYILGDPMMDVEARLWGKPVVVTTAIAANTALTGDFILYSHISRKLGLRIDVSDSHSTYFIENKLAIRAEMRESMEIYRGAAFCKCTSLT